MNLKWIFKEKKIYEWTRKKNKAELCIKTRGIRDKNFITAAILFKNDNIAIGELCRNERKTGSYAWQVEVYVCHFLLKMHKIIVCLFSL